MVTATAEATVKPSGWKRWGIFSLSLAGFLGLTVGMTAGFQALSKQFHFPIYDLAWVAYLVVFVSALLSNVMIMTPAPVSLSVMLSAASQWNPLLVGVAAGLGSSVGELSGYWVGHVGSKLAMRETFMCSIHRKFCIGQLSEWIKRHGAWAVGGLALQPVLPFDLAGLIAGAARMPLRKFFLALVTGKTIKYVALAYIAAQALNLMPIWRLQ